MVILSYLLVFRHGLTDLLYFGVILSKQLVYYPFILFREIRKIHEMRIVRVIHA